MSSVVPVPEAVHAHWHEPWRYAHASWCSAPEGPPAWAGFGQSTAAGQRLGAHHWFTHFGLVATAAEAPAPAAEPGLSLDGWHLTLTWLGIWLAHSMRLPEAQDLCRQGLALGLRPGQLRSALAMARPRSLLPRWPGQAPAGQAAEPAAALGVAALRFAITLGTALDWRRLAWCHEVDLERAAHPLQDAWLDTSGPAGFARHDVVRVVLATWRAGCRAQAAAAAAPHGH